MSEVKESVSVYLRLGDIEVGADERNQDRVEDVIDQLVKQFRTLL